MKRAMVRFRGAREKGATGICGMPGGLARSHDGESSVEGDLRREPGVA